MINAEVQVVMNEESQMPEVACQVRRKVVEILEKTCVFSEMLKALPLMRSGAGMFCLKGMK